jgi:hypothetical protein
LEALARVALSALAVQAPTDRVAEALFELMKYPLQRATETAETIRTVFKTQGAPGADAGQWALVAWARSRFPSLDLDAPAQSLAK